MNRLNNCMNDNSWSLSCSLVISVEHLVLLVCIMYIFFGWTACFGTDLTLFGLFLCFTGCVECENCHYSQVSVDVSVTVSH